MWLFSYQIVLNINHIQEYIGKLNRINIKSFRPQIHTCGRSDRITKQMIEEFEKNFSGVKLLIDNSPGNGKIPAITITNNISLSFIPERRYLEPIINVMAGIRILPENLRQKLKGQKELVTEIILFISRGCPYCLGMIEKTAMLAFAFSSISLRIIDASLFPEIVDSYNIKSVPAVSINDVIMQGDQKTEDLVEALLSDNNELHSKLVMKDLIYSGNAEQAARLILEKYDHGLALSNMLCDEKWPNRLGAMVTMEYLADIDVKCAESILLTSWEKFDEINDQVKGDLIHVAGMIGTESLKKRLTEVTSGDYAAGVKAVASEVLALFQ